MKRSRFKDVAIFYILTTLGCIPVYWLLAIGWAWLWRRLDIPYDFAHAVFWLLWDIWKVALPGALYTGAFAFCVLFFEWREE